jgi:hypothetical protein
VTLPLVLPSDEICPSSDSSLALFLSFFSLDASLRSLRDASLSLLYSYFKGSPSSSDLESNCLADFFPLLPFSCRRDEEEFLEFESTFIFATFSVFTAEGFSSFGSDTAVE